MLDYDTIAAIGTATGEGGIGIVRLSGDAAVAIADKIFIAKSGQKAARQESHSVAYGNITDPRTGTVIDEVLLIVMRNPRSYTREDVVEIHCHGGVMPLRRILELVLKSGARLAEPGEFTKRAFLNGRLDLTQAEAVIDVIRAKTDASLRMAVGHLGGVFSQKIEKYRDGIIALIAHLEAAIDFPEDDIEEIAAKEVEEKVREIIGEMDKLLATASTGKILREGLKTVIIGKPNVGKSSLLNYLLGETRAIVTDVPGTTRDIIEESVNIAGIPLIIVDTAGIRETVDTVERIGVQKAREVMDQADLVFLLFDASKPLSPEDKQVLSFIQDRRAIVLVNKTDLPSQIEIEEINKFVSDKPVIKISALEGTGIEDLEKIIVDMVYRGQVYQGEGAFISNVRHVNLLEEARNSLKDSLSSAVAGMPSDCIVIDLKNSWEKLGEIIGATVQEDIIDQIFSRFCIGK